MTWKEFRNYVANTKRVKKYRPSQHAEGKAYSHWLLYRLHKEETVSQYEYSYIYILYILYILYYIYILYRHIYFFTVWIQAMTTVNAKKFSTGQCLHGGILCETVLMNKHSNRSRDQLKIRVAVTESEDKWKNILLQEQKQRSNI